MARLPKVGSGHFSLYFRIFVDFLGILVWSRVWNRFFDFKSRFARFGDGLTTIFGEFSAFSLNSSDFVQMSTKHCVGAWLSKVGFKKKMRFSTPQKIKHHCRFGMENYKPKNRWKVGFGRLLGFIWEKFGATWGVFWTLLGAAWPFWKHCKSSLFKSGSKMNSKRPVGLILQSLMIFSLAFFILFFRFVLWVFDILPPYPMRVLNNRFLCFR